jgi:hypothetical protein
MTDEACKRCLALALEGQLRMEGVQRLPKGAWAPRAQDRSGSCCFDCAAADTLTRRTGSLTFRMARIAVANDRQEQYRMPGVKMGLVLAGITKPNEPGDFEKHLDWLDKNDWFGQTDPGDVDG